MKNILTFIIGFVLFLNGYSQSQTPKEIEQEKASIRIPMSQSNSNQVKSITFNLKGVPKNEQGALKDEFTTYKDKVITLIYNEDQESMVLVYKSIIPYSKILYILNNHGVSSSAILENE